MVHRVCKVQQVLFKVPKVFKVTKVLQELAEQMAHKVLQVPKVFLELMAPTVHKEPKAYKV